MTVTTSEFAIPHGRYLFTMIAHMARLPLLCAGIAALAALVAGVAFDLRWIVVALMILLIAVPMVATMIYFHYGLRPEGFVNVMPHTVSFVCGRVEVDVRFPAFRDKEDDESMSDAGATTEDRRRRYSFDLLPGMPYMAGSNALLIPLGKAREGLLMVPYSAFDGQDHLRRAIDILIDNPTPNI